jgi:CelD/BcsL family acetyltransferase involved in cellulose biosynthesis
VDQLAPHIEALERRASLIESLADEMPGVDPWCSTVDWILPAHQAFAPESEPLLVSEEGTGELLLARYLLPEGGVAIAGLEPLWGFACPVLAADSDAVADLLVETLDRDPEWDWLMLSGLPRTDVVPTLGRRLSHLGAVGYGEGITRRIADLRLGPDAWLERRSPKFRRQLRTAVRRADEVGLRFVDVSNEPDVFERCLAIERSSWKGMLGDGITSEHMHAFYEQMLARLQRNGRLRATVAQVGDTDVGFIFGGVRNRRYRGLQLSYVETMRPLSISHLLQHHTIRQLAAEPDSIHTYDLGMDMHYKQRWADHGDTSMVLVVERGPHR